MAQEKIKDLINEWKPRSVLADQIGAKVASVHKWHSANRIPAQWQSSVVRAAQAKGLSAVTAEWMLEAHAPDQATA